MFEKKIDCFLSQIRYIYWLSVGVIGIGMVFICLSIILAINSPQDYLIVLIIGLAGLITEIMGVIILHSYRSAMERIAQFAKSLEQISSITHTMESLKEDLKFNNPLKEVVVKDFYKYLIDTCKNEYD